VPFGSTGSQYAEDEKERRRGKKACRKPGEKGEGREQEDGKTQDQVADPIALSAPPPLPDK